jgi:hypothetical protein
LPQDYTESKFTVQLTHVGSGKSWPSLRGFIMERDVQIGSFSRGPVTGGYISPIKTKFFSERAQHRFMDSADTLSVAEIVEALLPPKAFGRS